MAAAICLLTLCAITSTALAKDSATTAPDTRIDLATRAALEFWQTGNLTGIRIDERAAFQVDDVGENLSDVLQRSAKKRWKRPSGCVATNARLDPPESFNPYSLPDSLRGNNVDVVAFDMHCQGKDPVWVRVYLRNLTLLKLAYTLELDAG